nr:MAG TPA: hypothetical protein [Caudoviricetes sp.]
MRAAFTAAVSGRDAGGASGGEAAHRADDLLPQGAGGAEHRGSVCGGGRAVIALLWHDEAGETRPVCRTKKSAVVLLCEAW